MSGVCEETRTRIRISVAAYAYEQGEEPIMTDGEFDRLCYSVDPNFETGNAEMDHFFRNEFQPHTGQWVHNHPDREGLARLLKIVGPRARTNMAIGELI